MHFLLVSHLLFNWGCVFLAFHLYVNKRTLTKFYEEETINKLTSIFSFLIRCFRIISAKHMTRFSTTLQFICLLILICFILFCCATYIKIFLVQIKLNFVKKCSDRMNICHWRLMQNLALKKYINHCEAIIDF